MLGILKHTITRFCLVAIATCFATACIEEKRSFVFVVDFSQSISDEAREKAFQAIQHQVSVLNRGDSVTVIPVTGDALTETNGKVVRLLVPDRRESFDNDLRKFREEAGVKLKEMYEGTQPYRNTDLFGALSVAFDEISTKEMMTHERVFLIVLSDMVNSTAEIRFENSSAFRKPEASIDYAKTFSESQKDCQITDIYAGILESTDLRKMAKERRDAVRVFWEHYFFSSCPGARYKFVSDGTGQLASFVAFTNER